MKVERKTYIGILLIVFVLVFANWSAFGANRVIKPDEETYESLIRDSNDGLWTATGANIQLAIWDLNGTGGDVEIPPGLYETTNITIENGVNLIGCGSNPTNCTIRFTASPGITIKGSGAGGYNGVRISNLCIQEKPVAQKTDIGLQILGVRGNGVIIENVLFGTGTGNGYGFEVANIDIYKSRYVTLIGVTSRNCTGNGLRVRGITGDNSNVLTLINCHIAHNNRSNIRMWGAYDCTIIGGTVQYSTTEDGIWANDTANGLRVYGCDVEGNARFGIHLDSIDGGNIQVCTGSQGVRGIEVNGTSSYNTFHINGHNSVANTIQLNASTHNNTVLPTICPVTDSGTNNLIFKYGQVSLFPYYPQTNPPTLSENTTAYWYNTTGGWLYQIANSYGTQYYLNMSTTY